jgi:short-subunit dehydrogenase
LIETLNANTFPSVFMTRFLGPKLKERSTGDKKSAIINFTSYYTEWPAFNAPLFSAGKSFSDCVSQVVAYENPSVDVLTVKGMPVQSQRNPYGV